MNIELQKDLWEKPAKVISAVFHPLFMPLYGLVIVFSAPTFLGYLSEPVKKILFFIVLVNNVFVPVTLLPFLKARKIISSYNIEEREERIMPLAMVSILYSLTSFIIFRFQIPLFLKSFIFASSFLSITVTVINFWWKISIHSLGAGAITAVVVLLSMKSFVPLTWYLAGVITVAGLILSSRLHLRAHNPLQVWIGFLIGFLGVALFMLLA